MIANDTTGKINPFYLEPMGTLLVNPLFYELSFSHGALLRCPSACRAGPHQVPPGELFQSIISSPSCKIFGILPPSSNGLYQLRKQRSFAQLIVKTQSFGKSFIIRSSKEAFY